jgi:hypothetical protein
MKKIILLVLLGFSISTSAQLADTLFVSKLNDAEWVKLIPNSTKFKYLKFADGSILQIGDKMLLGKPSGTNTSNQQTPGVFGSTNQTVNNFTYLMLGRMGSAILSGITYLPELFKGREVEIEDIKFAKNGKKATSAGVMVIFKNPGMDITVLNLDFALQYGELINPKASMTSDQALAELQKAKTKLDLGVITKEEYENIKKGLMEIIK